MKLSPEQIKFLKKATGVILNAYGNVREADHSVRALIQDRSKDVETALEFVVPGRVTQYRSGVPGGEMTRAFAYVQNSHYEPHWKTVTNFLRVGDEIYLHWIAGNNNQSLDAAGLFHDQVDLIVVRGKKEYHFLIDSQICPNNSARMFRFE